jgi:hypothetical protein|nr:MAG TPA: hypothetical protein [Caudoviricetes sp.]
MIMFADLITPIYIFAAIGGLLGGIQNLLRPTGNRRKKPAPIPRRVALAILNLMAGVFASFIAVDLLVPDGKVLWAWFIGMAAGAVGGYFIETVITVAPTWFAEALPKFLDHLLSIFGYAKVGHPPPPPPMEEE